MDNVLNYNKEVLTTSPPPNRYDMHSHLNLVSCNVSWLRILLRCILKLLLPGKSRPNAVLLNPIRYTIQLNPVSSVLPSSSETGFQIKKWKLYLQAHADAKKLICFAQNINISRLGRHLAKLSDVPNMIMAILRFAPNSKRWQLTWQNLFYLTVPKVIMFIGK